MDIGYIPNLTRETARIKREEFIMQIGEGNLKKPKTVTLEEYFVNPFFPAVFKYELMDNGYDKFLIETEEQLEKIKALFDMHGKRFGEGVTKNCVFQQLIKPPTKQATYLRVLMGASGEVIGASLRYQIEDAERRKMGGIFEPWFSNPESEYYLGCKRMFSTRSKDGFIHLSAPKFSDEKSKILKAHGIDPNNAEVPFTISEPLSRMMQEHQGLFGLVCGFDFIMDSDGTWYYLENQIQPNTREWGEPKGFRIPKEPANRSQTVCVEWIVNRFVLDLRMRHDELMKCLGLTYTYEAVMRDEEPESKTIINNNRPLQTGITRRKRPRRKRKS